MINKRKNQKGFTLVELLVVIAIIGILAVVAVPALFKNINKAKVADLESDYSAIKSAVLSYYTEENTITEDITQLSEHMDSIPTKSALGEGGYSLVKGTSTDKALYLTVGEKNAIICGNHVHEKNKCYQENETECYIEVDSSHKSHDNKCYSNKGVTLTKEQLKRILEDIGKGKVYVGANEITEENIDSNIGEDKVLKLTLIENIDM